MDRAVPAAGRGSLSATIPVADPIASSGQRSVSLPDASEPPEPRLEALLFLALAFAALPANALAGSILARHAALHAQSLRPDKIQAQLIRPVLSLRWRCGTFPAR